MHPDQKTPASHRYRAADSNSSRKDQADNERDDALSSRRPEQDQDTAAIPASGASDEPGSAPEMDGARVAEAGNAYVGRTMDDDLKSSPRVDEPGAGRAEG